MLQTCNASTLVLHGPEAVQALCLHAGRRGGQFDMLILRQVSSILKNTVMISELQSIRKLIDTMLYVSYTIKQLLGPMYMQ